MQTNLNIEQRKTLLTGLGFRVVQIGEGVSSRWRVYSHTNEIVGYRSSEQAAYESIQLDMNFCVEVLVPWMEAKNYSFVLARHNGTQNKFRAVFDREDNDNYEVDFAVHDDNPATAICLAALQSMRIETNQKAPS